MGEIGPVEYVVIGFPGNRFKGEIVPAVSGGVARRQHERMQQAADAEAWQAQQAQQPWGAPPRLRRRRHRRRLRPRRPRRRSTWSPS